MHALLIDEHCKPFSQKPERNWKGQVISKPADWIRQSRALSRAWTSVVEVLPLNPTREDPCAQINSAIEESRTLLDLQDGWDGEEAKPIDLATWDKAVDTLRWIVSSIHELNGCVLSAPAISACADGSIDLFWQTETMTLLINVKAGVENPEFYGEASSGISMKGRFDRSARALSVINLLVDC